MTNNTHYNNKKRLPGSFEIQFFILIQTYRRYTDTSHIFIPGTKSTSYSITRTIMYFKLQIYVKLQSSSNSLSPQTLHIFFTIFVRVRSIFRNNKISFLLHARTTMITKNIDGKWTTPKQQC